jgi:photosystem II stability/assembly factor-like uncharacterized protein
MRVTSTEALEYNKQPVPDWIISMKIFFVAAGLFGFPGSIAPAQWQQQAINTDANFRGLCAVSATVAWVSGTKGTYGRTTDGGATWSAGQVPGAEKLDFRDVEAFDATTAYLLSAGPGQDSRIYKTIDGGRTWELQFQNPDRDAFFDGIGFWDEQHGIALSDPVKGHFPLIVTNDSGTNWTPLDSKNLPPALPNEGAFAASGTCLVTHGPNDVWFGTGGAKTARVFHSNDRGQHWTVSDTPIVAGTPSAGIFSLAFRDATHGLIGGGGYRKPNDSGPNAAITADGGRTWKLIDKPFAYRSGVAWAKNGWIAVGTSGSDISADDGATWKPLDWQNYNSVSFTPTGEGWAVGPKGRIARFVN